MNTNPIRKSRLRTACITLALGFVILSPFSGALRAQDADGQPQTAEEATTILTSGHWRFHGVTRTFLPDGTFKSKNGNVGTWKLLEDQLEIDMGTKKWRFFFPINPTGTRGELEGHGKDKGDLLIKIPS